MAEHTEKAMVDIDALQDSIIGAYDLCHVRSSDVLDLIQEVRAWRAAGVVAEEPEWEYGCASSSHRRFAGPAIPLPWGVEPNEHGEECPSPALMRRRKPGPWVPVEQGDET